MYIIYYSEKWNNIQHISKLIIFIKIRYQYTIKNVDPKSLQRLYISKDKNNKL